MSLTKRDSFRRFFHTSLSYPKYFKNVILVGRTTTFVTNLSSDSTFFATKIWSSQRKIPFLHQQFLIGIYGRFMPNDIRFVVKQ